MGLPDLFRRSDPDYSPSVVRLSRVIDCQEAAVVEHQARTWAAAEQRRIDISARGELTRHALAEDRRTYHEGIAAAEGDAVLEELMLRYLQDQNDANRDDVRRF